MGAQPGPDRSNNRVGSEELAHERESNTVQTQQRLHGAKTKVNHLRALDVQYPRMGWRRRGTIRRPQSCLCFVSLTGQRLLGQSTATFIFLCSEKSA